MSGAQRPLIGVLALQGGFAAHAAMLRRAGASMREVRTAADLQGLDGLVLPGGESTSMTLGIEREAMAGPLRDLHERGTPMLGTCAGMIMLDRDHLGLMDVRAERNAFGRQVRSFETDVSLAGIEGGPMRAVFIRAPWIAERGPGVGVLAELDGRVVAVEQGNLVSVAFHPELTRDARLHERFVALVRERMAATGPAAGG